MQRRDFIMALGLAAVWPLAVQAQQPKKVPRIGFLTTGSLELPETRTTLNAFRQQSFEVVEAEFFFQLLRGPMRTVENGTNFLFENLLRQRLLHQLDTGIEAPFINDGVPRIARHEQHPDPRL